MVDIALLQSVSYIAGALGVCVAAAYYVINLREQKQTRQFQLLMQISQHTFSKESKRDFLEWSKMEWKDYEDFMNKYGSDVNPESFAVRDIQATYYHLLGILVKRGMISKDLMYDWGGENAIFMWHKYKDVALAQRKLYNRSQMHAPWEYLYGEMLSVAKERGVDTSVYIRSLDAGFIDERRRKLAEGQL